MRTCSHRDAWHSVRPFKLQDVKPPTSNRHFPFVSSCLPGYNQTSWLRNSSARPCATCHGYTPGEQPDAGERVVKLNTNENPFPPGGGSSRPSATSSRRRCGVTPIPGADAFRVAAAKLHGIEPEMILCGNGSDDILTIATRTAIPPGGRSRPGPDLFALPRAGPAAGRRGRRRPVGRGLAAPDRCARRDQGGCDLPCESQRPQRHVRLAAEGGGARQAFPGLLLVDEAYADFGDDNCIALVKEFENVVISRTLSKAYSLAGLRFGYAVRSRR